MEKEEAETVASQERLTTGLRRGLVRISIDMNVGGDDQAVTEETLFWTEEVEAELNRWDEEKFRLAEVNR